MRVALYFLIGVGVLDQSDEIMTSSTTVEE